MPEIRTVFTDITTIVVLAALQQQAELAAIAADPEGGAGTFVPGAPLRRASDPTNAVAAYWCRWNMKAGQRAAFAQTMGGPMQIIPPGGQVNTNRDRWMFDSVGGWSPDEVLAVLGLAVMPPADI
jgi:hypothetical protein